MPRFVCLSDALIQCPFRVMGAPGDPYALDRAINPGHHLIAGWRISRIKPLGEGDDVQAQFPSHLFDVLGTVLAPRFGQ